MMIGSIRHVYAFLFFLLIIFSISSIRLGHCTSSTGITTCPEIEKHALLSFKNSSSNDNVLHTWNECKVDCCTWEGVVCNNLTGHVIELHLQNSFGDSSSTAAGFNGILNPSLLNLKHLRHLDLSFNSFGGTIPAFVGSFAKLEYLDLSANRFYGAIPHTIGNLSSLRTLSLSQSRYSDLSLRVDSLEWLSGLSHLEHLDMSYVDLSNANDNWLQIINTLPSLLELRFRNCSLQFIKPLNEVNFSSLNILDLSQNKFQSDVPMWIFQLNKLTHLDLSKCYFEGLLPSTSNITELQYINLSFNNFNSTIPDWIFWNKPLEVFDMSYNALHGSISNAIENLTSLSYLGLSNNELSGEIPSEISQMCKMKGLDLSFNNLQGNISNAFGDMSDCFLGVLEGINLTGNQLSGHLTYNFGELKSLQYLLLGANLLSGPIPFSLGKLVLLKDLRLSANNFTGNLPESFGQLLNLEILSIGYNKLEGVVTESHFTKLTKLSWFYASGNQLSLNVDPNWIPPFQLYDLTLGSWDLGAGTQIPTWLDTQKNHLRSQLDLSNTGISGEVPTWFWNIRSLNLSHNQLYGKIPFISLTYLDLSSNKFYGSLPRVANTTLQVLYLSNNSFSGDISHFLCGTTNETHSLTDLHLGGNMLSGKLPGCWSKLPDLWSLNLGSNNIYGTISNSIGLLTELRSLNLHNNSLSGQIPSSIQNCTKLLKIDLGYNKFAGNIPTGIGTSLSNLRILILRSNKLNGKIPSTICHLNSLQILDLSDNMFLGKIPSCIDNFTAMTTKRQRDEFDDYDLESASVSLKGIVMYYYRYKALCRESASVAMKGTVMEYSTTLTLVTNIDLSRNKLSGEIPMQLTRLVELRSLNLSMNNLRGTIPYGIGEMKQLESLDLKRNSLSGEIPNTLAVLTSLDYLNLSFNDLIGKIPESTQLQSLDASGFIGNKLFGPPLAIKCDNGGQTYDPGYHQGNKTSVLSEVDWFYVLLSLGYATGFSVVCTTLVLKKSWRDAYFQALEDIWNKICVYTSMKLRKSTTA